MIWLTLVAALALGLETVAADGPTPTPSPAARPATVTPVISQPSQSIDPNRDREDQLAVMLGRARVQAGILPLARSKALDRAALAHAQDMVAGAYMDHDAPDGSTPTTRAASAGYETRPGTAWLVVETISAISDEPDGALGWWLSDALHHRVLMRTYWRELGVGYASGGPYGRFWIALFGCRPNVLPPVLLDGILAIPTEACGTAADAFGPVQSVRVAESIAAAATADWMPYTAEQPWPIGHTAVVDLRDASGAQLEALATDPTGAPAPAP